MAHEIDFYTVTMAKVYADQGHTEKAARIYRFLLEKHPDRRDLQEALAELEEGDDTQGKASDEKLVALIHHWLDLLLRYKRVQKLKKFKDKPFRKSTRP